MKMGKNCLVIDITSPLRTATSSYWVAALMRIVLNDRLILNCFGSWLITVFSSYGPWAGELSSCHQGSLVVWISFEVVSHFLKFIPASNFDKLSRLHLKMEALLSSYALFNALERGLLFVQPGYDAYKGQLVRIHQRPGDLSINMCNKKAATISFPQQGNYMQNYICTQHSAIWWFSFFIASKPTTFYLMKLSLQTELLNLAAVT